MADGNFSNIEGFNDGPRREHPGLRAAVAAALLAAVGFVGWQVLPYLAALILVAAP
jgi:hypothetical protein